MLEIGLGGVLIAGLEDEARARRDLASGALARDEALLDIALIRIPEPLGDPDGLHYLRLEISGHAVPISLPEDSAQRCRTAEAQIDCELRVAPLPSAPTQPSSALPEPSSLQSTLTVPSRDPRIAALAAQIAAGRSLPLDQARAIVEWMKANIRREAADAFSALDVLAARRGECQGHAYLYAALARALGIPTRVANGLVYSPELQGTRASSQVSGWASTLRSARSAPIRRT
jgi:transglutaminase-like putative cysteine protease